MIQESLLAAMMKQLDTPDEGVIVVETRNVDNCKAEVIDVNSGQ